ncbi:MAG: cobalamin biosynthesis protein CbiX [Opitutae bacterium]|nr:cobalamin biosynthesis protein CbiX [Opitutae bacterium]
MPDATTLLVDNGSLEPAATLTLRELAAKLSARLGFVADPVSLLHSAGIDPVFLGGRPAEILFPALERRRAGGQNEFVLVPLFFGPSAALTDCIPENVARLRQKFPGLRVALAPPLHAAGDGRLAQILADNVQAELTVLSRASPLPQNTVRVALVDHGSPVAAVTAVRDDLARQVAGLLGPRVTAVAPCSMERRPEPAYDFCAPLLAGLLSAPPWNAGHVVVAMQFLLPGRHAGPDGDVAAICRAAEAAQPALKTRMTALAGAHPLLVEILADRWRAAVPLS